MSRFCTALCSENLKGSFIWTLACLPPQSKVALISIVVNVTRCQWSMQSVLVAVMFGVKPKLDTNDKYKHDRLMGTCWPENHSAEVNTYSTDAELPRPTRLAPRGCIHRPPLSLQQVHKPKPKVQQSWAERKTYQSESEMGYVKSYTCRDSKTVLVKFTVVGFVPSSYQLILSWSHIIIMGSDVI